MELEWIRDSGLLELYVLGDLSNSDTAMVEEALGTYAELKDELIAIEASFEKIAFAYKVPHGNFIKPEVLMEVDYIERLAKGESPSLPPSLHAGSQISEYDTWLEREDMQMPTDFEEMAGRIIGNTDDRSTMIIWLNNGAPSERHTTKIESFLIVEGTCDIVIDGEFHALFPGDQISIPLHTNHRIQVTSNVPCKAILERKSA